MNESQEAQPKPEAGLPLGAAPCSAVRCTTPLCGGVAVMQERYVVSWRPHQKKCATCYDRARHWRLGQWVPINPPNAEVCERRAEDAPLATDAQSRRSQH